MDFKTVERDLGWQPKTNFDDGLRQTIDWFQGYLRARKGPHN